MYTSLLWGDSGVIESPNYPDPYGPNMDCLWLLQTADEDARIKLVCDTIQVWTWGRCYDHNFRQFSAKKLAFFLKNQCYDLIFA
jgi:hypothetical protein